MTGFNIDGQGGGLLNPDSLEDLNRQIQSVVKWLSEHASKDPAPDIQWQTPLHDHLKG